MASIEKIKATIADIAQRRRNVLTSEIDWVIGQLKENGFDVRNPRKTRHGLLYGVGSLRFSVCTHHPGGKQVKACYIDDFIDAMTELGLYEE
jgi:hypothetical protein